jgi:hypothetical protein
MRRFGFSIAALISPALFAGRVSLSKSTTAKTTTKPV